jgi:hypothetical protein
MMLDRFFRFINVLFSTGEYLFQALRLVNNRSLEDALAVVFGESHSFSSEPVQSLNGASVEQATQVYESVC